MNEKNGVAIEASNLSKIYHRGSESIAAVDDVTLSVKDGEYVAFIGPSGRKDHTDRHPRLLG